MTLSSADASASAQASPQASAPESAPAIAHAGDGPPPDAPALDSRLPGIGGWLFRSRSWLPVPLVLLLLIGHWGRVGTPAVMMPIGAALVLLGEFMRLWAVRQIGVISRTRSGRLGRLVTEGPFSLVRNPLYVGNLLLWTGFTVWSGKLWLLALAWTLFLLQYSAIIRFEETLLTQRFGEEYTAYMTRVPRWWPRLANLGLALGDRAHHPWRDTLFSERGTLIAVAAISTLLVIVLRWW
jgi:protein-S-isoprenylcysteine O-methyltransferase Ste14